MLQSGREPVTYHKRLMKFHLSSGKPSASWFQQQQIFIKVVGPRYGGNQQMPGNAIHPASVAKSLHLGGTHRIDLALLIEEGKHQCYNALIYLICSLLAYSLL